MLYSQLGYLTLLQAYVRGGEIRDTTTCLPSCLILVVLKVMPTDPTKRAPGHALKRVDEELRHRELKIQGELITLRPLVS